MFFFCGDVSVKRAAPEVLCEQLFFVYIIETNFISACSQFLFSFHYTQRYSSVKQKLNVYFWAASSFSCPKYFRHFVCLHICIRFRYRFRILRRLLLSAFEHVLYLFSFFFFAFISSTQKSCYFPWYCRRRFCDTFRLESWKWVKVLKCTKSLIKVAW
jgi:hypothetical protein